MPTSDPVLGPKGTTVSPTRRDPEPRDSPEPEPLTRPLSPVPRGVVKLKWVGTQLLVLKVWEKTLLFISSCEDFGGT